jgi:protein tyrosine/serine phosphatase
MNRFQKTTTALICGCIFLLGAAQATAQTASVAPAGSPAEHLTLDGIENFGRVGQALYRGAQPKPFALNELQNIGVTIVVDFRDEKNEIAEEKRNVEALGMQFVSLPWAASLGPVPDEIAAFLALVREHPDKKIFVHCKHGADRTGLMVALYRMTFDHWSASQAVEEMQTFHYHSFLLPNLARYVRGYSVQVSGGGASNPADAISHTSH